MLFHFMRAVNRSSREGCLTCSFIDKDVTRFIQFKKRQHVIPRKRAVAYIGRHMTQEGQVWVLGPSMHLDKSGVELDLSQSQFIWIGHLVSAIKIAREDSQLIIPGPISTESLSDLFSCLEKIMQHNFCAAVLTLSAAAMAVHYTTILDTNHYCHVPFLTGVSGTGKTMSLRSAL